MKSRISQKSVRDRFIEDLEGAEYTPTSVITFGTPVEASQKDLNKKWHLGLGLNKLKEKVNYENYKKYYLQIIEEALNSQQNGQDLRRDLIEGSEDMFRWGLKKVLQDEKNGKISGTISREEIVKEKLRLKLLEKTGGLFKESCLVDQDRYLQFDKLWEESFKTGRYAGVTADGSSVSPDQYLGIVEGLVDDYQGEDLYSLALGLGKKNEIYGGREYSIIIQKKLTLVRQKEKEDEEKREEEEKKKREDLQSWRKDKGQSIEKRREELKEKYREVLKKSQYFGNAQSNNGNIFHEGNFDVWWNENSANNGFAKILQEQVDPRKQEDIDRQTKQAKKEDHLLNDKIVKVQEQNDLQKKENNGSLSGEELNKQTKELDDRLLALEEEQKKIAAGREKAELQTKTIFSNYPYLSLQVIERILKKYEGRPDELYLAIYPGGQSGQNNLVSTINETLDEIEKEGSVLKIQRLFRGTQGRKKAEERRIAVSYDTEIDHVKQEYMFDEKGVPFLIPTIIGDETLKNGRVQQDESGLLIFQYDGRKGLNRLSSQIASHEIPEESDALMTSFAEIKNFDGKESLFCIATSSKRGVSQSFVSKEKIDEIREKSKEVSDWYWQNQREVKLIQNMVKIVEEELAGVEAAAALNADEKPNKSIELQAYLNGLKDLIDNNVGRKVDMPSKIDEFQGEFQRKFGATEASEGALKKTKEMFDNYQAGKDKIFLKEDEEAKKFVLRYMSRQISKEIERSIWEGKYQFDVDSQEKEKITKSFSENFTFFTSDKQERLKSILDAPTPNAPFAGVSILRPAGAKKNQVTVLFNNVDKDGNDEAYLHIKGTDNFYVRTKVCTEEGPVTVYRNGKPSEEEHKKGDVIIDEKTVFHLNKKTGEYDAFDARSHGKKELIKNVTKLTLGVTGALAPLQILEHGARKGLNLIGKEIEENTKTQEYGFKVSDESFLDKASKLDKDFPGDADLVRDLYKKFQLKAVAIDAEGNRSVAVLSDKKIVSSAALNKKLIYSIDVDGLPDAEMSLLSFEKEENQAGTTTSSLLASAGKDPQEEYVPVRKIGNQLILAKVSYDEQKGVVVENELYSIAEGDNGVGNLKKISETSYAVQGNGVLPGLSGLIRSQDVSKGVGYADEEAKKIYSGFLDTEFVASIVDPGTNEETVFKSKPVLVVDHDFSFGNDVEVGELGVGGRKIGMKIDTRKNTADKDLKVEVGSQYININKHLQSLNKPDAEDFLNELELEKEKLKNGVLIFGNDPNQSSLKFTPGAKKALKPEDEKIETPKVKESPSLGNNAKFKSFSKLSRVVGFDNGRGN